jgi:hypothetical protein
MFDFDYRTRYQTRTRSTIDNNPENGSSTFSANSAVNCTAYLSKRLSIMCVAGNMFSEIQQGILRFVTDASKLPPTNINNDQFSSYIKLTYHILTFTFA